MLQERFGQNLPCLVKEDKIYLEKTLVGQTERLHQGPSKAGFRVKLTKYLRGSTLVINDRVETRGNRSCCFIGKAAFSQPMKFTVSASKPLRARTVVANTHGLTYFCTGPSIQTRITFAAAIDTRDLTIT